MILAKLMIITGVLIILHLFMLRCERGSKVIGKESGYDAVPYGLIDLHRAGDIRYEIYSRCTLPKVWVCFRRTVFANYTGPDFLHDRRRLIRAARKYTALKWERSRKPARPLTTNEK